MSWGDADAGDDPGGTDAPGADADFDGRSTGVDEGLGGGGGGDVTGDDGQLGEVSAQRSHKVDDGAGVTVRGVDDDDIDAGLDESSDATPPLGADADGGPDDRPRASETDRGKCSPLLDVRMVTSPTSRAVIVDDDELFDAVAVHEPLGLLASISRGER